MRWEPWLQAVIVESNVRRNKDNSGADISLNRSDRIDLRDSKSDVPTPKLDRRAGLEYPATE
jgi:hypothetical protein